MRGQALQCSTCSLTAGATPHVIRICPGQGFAQVEMFVIIAMVLHVFDITPPLDENGDPIVVEPKVEGDSFLL